MDSLEDIKSQLLAIFRFYSSFGDRTNLTNLKSNKFHKLCHDANITLDHTSLDLIFCKMNKNRPNMNFQTFLNCLNEISQKLYHES